MIDSNNLLAQLVSVQQGLLTVSENSEADFLQLGQELQTGYVAVSQLVSQALKATEVTDQNDDDNALKRAENGVSKALDSLRNKQVIVGSKSEPVKAVVGYFDDLNQKRAEIETIARYLRAVALNIFIETARTEITNQNFSIIAVEIKELSEKIIDMAKSIRSDSEYAKNYFMEMYSKVSMGIDALSGLTGDAEDSVMASIRSIRELMDFSLSAVQQAEEMSRHISGEVETIVVGVQFHDDMRQRIEHIVAAMKDTEHCCGAVDNISDETELNKIGSLHTVLLVQSAQIKKIIEELDVIYSKNRLSFENIINEIEQMVQVLSSESNFGSGDEDMFTGLAVALSDFQKLENQGSELIVTLGDAYSHASKTTQALSDQTKEINGISQESHIKALNAIIATQNMGLEGQTLLTLAGEMKILSQQAGSFVTDVSAIIDSIVLTVRKINIDENESNQGEGTNVNDDDLNMIVMQISIICAQMQNDADNITLQANELKVNLTLTKERLDFFPLIGKALRNQLEELNHVIALLTPLVPDDVKEASHEKLKNDVYTMQKEREIHEQALNELALNEGAASVDTNGELSDEDQQDKKDIDSKNADEEFDDNVELF